MSTLSLVRVWGGGVGISSKTVLADGFLQALFYWSDWYNNKLIFPELRLFGLLLTVNFRRLDATVSY